MGALSKASQMFARSSLKKHTTLATTAFASTLLFSNEEFRRYFSINSVYAQAMQDSKFKKEKTNQSISKKLQFQQFSRKIDGNFSSPVSWFETNHYAANYPIEDRHCECSLLKNEAYFFGIFDGHSGWHCSETLRLNLPLYISLAFLNENLLNEFSSRKLCHGDLIEYLGNPDDDCQTFLTPNGYKNKQNNLKTGPYNFVQFMNTAKYSTSEILKYTFLSMDRDITLEAIPDGECNEPIWAGLSGSVAIGAYVKGNDLFVASTGKILSVYIFSFLINFL